jgi:O-methyltransferase
MKAALKWALIKAGFELHRLPAQGAAEYEHVYPSARYSPWNADPEFLKTYNLIREYTLVDIYRCWELWTLVEQAAKRSGSILEVGVWRGGTGALMADNAPSKTVYLCDTFKGVVKAGENDTEYKGREHADASVEIVERLLGKLEVDNVTILEGIFPDDTEWKIPTDERFSLCHIDVDVYQSAKDVLEWVWPRLVSGGIVVYDDYGFENCAGITKHVNEQVGLKDRLVLHNLNGHAIVIKCPA